MSYLALAVIAGLAAVERKGFLQAMLSRPVALGAIVGAVLDDTATGLLVGVPLELLFLGAVNMGAALPVHEALGAAASAGGAVLAVRGLPGAGPAVSAAAAALAVTICVPLAWIGRRADAWVEGWNEHLYARAEHDLARGDAAVAVRANVYGVALPFAVAFALAPVGAAVAGVVARAVLAATPAAAGPLSASWLALGGLACASGARSMRSRRAPVAFAAGLGAALVLTVVWLTAGGAR